MNFQGKEPFKRKLEEESDAFTNFKVPEGTLSKTSVVRTHRSQKFSILSLSKNRKGVNETKNDITRCAGQSSTQLVESAIRNDIFDNIDDTQILMKRNVCKNGSELLPSKSYSDSIVQMKSSQKSEAVTCKNYLSNETENLEMSLLSQFFTNTHVMNQIESVLSQEKKSPKSVCSVLSEVNESAEKTQNNEDFGNVFANTSRREMEYFFDQIEHSVSVMGMDQENKDEHISKILEVILSTQRTNGADVTISQKDDLSTSMSGFNSSFASALKQIFLSNASKDTKITRPLNNTIIQQNAKFIDFGPFYGLPLKVKELIKMYKGIDNLYDWQDECLQLPAIKQRTNLIYALPTSGGKTLVAEILMLREIICYRRNAIFILPYVAIVQEKVWGLSPFAVALDFLVEEYAASKGTYPPRKRRRKNSIYIATIEKALGLINSLIETERIHEIGMMVVDELHLVGEQRRGCTLEALLSKIMFLKTDIQIIGMSATIGNVNDLCTWLNAEVYIQNFRPVELVEYVKCGPEIAKINYHNEELLSMTRRIDHYPDATNNNVDPDKLGTLVMEVIPKESCLIFCRSKKNCENVAHLLCKVVKKNLKDYKREEKSQIKNALKDESGSLCKIFNVSIELGIAYHHSGLTSDERMIIEDAFRRGVISVICCTSTLAAGVNLPAKRVILRQPYVGTEFISLSKYKQMVGRAGRAGLGEAGDSILICNSNDLPKVRKLLLSPMDEVLSNIHEGEGKGLRHLLLSCISLGVANSRALLQEVSKNTLLNIQSNRLQTNVKSLTDKVISDLFKLGALQEADLKKSENHLDCNVTVKMETSFTNLPVEEVTPICKQTTSERRRRIVLKNDTKLVVSKLGCAAIKGNFELTRAHMLYDDLHQAQKSLVLLDSLHLLYLVTPYDTAEQIKPNKTDYYNIYCGLGPNELQTARILGLNDSIAIKMLSNQPIKNIPERVLNRFYLTLMLYDLWNETPVFEVSQKFQVNRGIVQHLMTSSATFASNVVHFCEGLEEYWTFAHLLKGMSLRLSHCCVRELLPLMELPAVKQNRARQLYNAGYKSLRSIAAADAENLVEVIDHMPGRVARQLIAAAKMLLLEKVENLREEAEDVLDGVDTSTSIDQTLH